MIRALGSAIDCTLILLTLVAAVLMVDQVAGLGTRPPHNPAAWTFTEESP